MSGTVTTKPNRKTTTPSSVPSKGLTRLFGFVAKESDAKDDPVARSEFQKSEQSLRKLRSTFGLAVGVIMMPTGAALDATFYPDSIGALTTIRMATTVVLAIGLWMFWRLELGKLVAPLSVVLVLIPSLAMSLMIHWTDGGRSNYFYGLILLMIIVHMLGFNFLESLTYCVAVIASYAAAVVFNDQFSSTDLTMLIRGLFFLVTSGSLCVLICYLNRENRWHSFYSQRQTQRESQSRLDFLADVSHELRTPLTLIAAPLDEILASPGQLHQTVGQRLAIMRRNVDRLRLLVDDVLDVVQDGSESFTLNREEIDVREFLEQVVSLTEDAARAVQISLVLRGETTPLEVLADPAKLERVISNLIGNAMKFSPPNTTIMVCLSRSDDEVLVEVMDEGPGISAKDCDQLFKRSFQGDNVGRELTARGQGLGLAIASKIVQAHGGRIDGRNRESGGANFRVWLPLNRSHDHAWRTDEGPQSAKFNAEASFLKKESNRLSLASLVSSTDEIGSAANSPTANAQLDQAEGSPTASEVGKILVIDDEPELRSYLADCLHEKYHVETARTGREGIEKAAANQPDCVLLDLMLPDSNDFSVLHQLRTDVRLSDAKILMLTANADETIKLAALRQGANDFLSKPFGVSELRARVDSLVESSQLQRQLREEKSRIKESLEDLKESELKLLHSEKMRSIADLSAGLLHEIHNPVNYSLMAISAMRRRTGLDEQSVETLDDIREGVTRISDIVTDLRAFAHPEQQRVMAVVDLLDAVRTAKRFAAGELDGIDIVVEKDGPLHLPVHGSKSQIVQLFLNVIMNAKHAIDRRNQVTGKEGPGDRDWSIESENCDATANQILISATTRRDRLVVSVADDGGGMSDEQLARVREPFFTADNQRGLGLGIPICQSIIEIHGGSLKIDSQSGFGTTVSFDFELAQPSDQSAGLEIAAPETKIERANP